MDQQHFDLLETARGLAVAADVIRRAVGELISEADTLGVDKTKLARALQVHRSTIYRTSCTAK